MEKRKYDGTLGMFVEQPRDVSMPHLRFLRFRAERGDFGPRPLSQPKGEFVFKLTDEQIAGYVNLGRDEAMRVHIVNNGGL